MRSDGLKKDANHPLSSFPTFFPLRNKIELNNDHPAHILPIGDKPSIRLHSSSN